MHAIGRGVALDTATRVGFCWLEPADHFVRVDFSMDEEDWSQPHSQLLSSFSFFLFFT